MFLSPSQPNTYEPFGRKLAAAVVPLRNATASIESLFFDLGALLGRGIDAIGRSSEALEAVSGHMTGEDVAAPSAILAGAAARLATAGGRAETADDELGKIRALVEAMPRHLVRLHKTVRDIRAVVINARIEASMLRSGHDDFASFTGQIGRLAELAEAGLAALERELPALRAMLDAATDGRSAFVEAHGQSLATVAARIDCGLGNLARHRHEAASALARNASGLDQARRRMGDAVMALQIGDITRQRIEHIQHAFVVLDQALEESLDQDERDLLVGMVCRLQAAQLHHAADDLGAESARLAESLSILAEQGRSLGEEGASIFGGARTGQSFLDDLRRDMAMADDLLMRYAEGHQAVAGSVQAVSTSVSEMVRHVDALHSIEVDMRIMGLNAALKCGRLGDEGRVLNVIAQELRASATRTVDDAGALMGYLAEAIELAAGLASRTRAEAAGSDLTDVIGAMGDAIGTLEAAARRADPLLDRLEADSATACAVMAEAAERMAANGRLESALRDIAQGIEAFSLPDDPNDPRLERIRSRVRDMLEARYTMACEREVHLLFAGESVSATEPDASAISVDDLLF